MRALAISTICLAAFCAVPSTALAQAAPADSYQVPMGARAESDMMRPFTIGVRDENGNRIIINGRPVSAGGSTLAAPGSFGSTSRSVPGSTLGRSTLSAVSIGNSITINNVRNSVIMIDQRNDAPVTSTITTSADGE